MISKALKFAMSNPRVRDILTVLKPKGAGEIAWRFGPELAYGGFSALAAPEGTTLGERGLIGLEDIGIGLGASILGQGAGAGVAGALARKRNLAAGQLKGAPKKWVMNPATEQLMRQGTNIGDFALQLPINYFAPRPAFQGALEKSYARQQAAQQATQPKQTTASIQQRPVTPEEAQAMLQRREIIEAILTGLAGAGAYASTGSVPRAGSASPSLFGWGTGL